MEKKRLIIMFGAPGSGEGIIGDALVQAFGFQKISTGDILRDEVKKQTPLGRLVAGYVSNGLLVNDDIVNNIVKDLLDGSSQDVLLDGYPRNLAQCDFLLNLIKDDFELHCVYLEAPEELIIARIEQRRICADCGKTHLAQDGCCPACGGESIIRKDDAQIRERFNQYKWITEQVFWKRLYPVCCFTDFIDCGDLKKATDRAIDAFTPF